MLKDFKPRLYQETILNTCNNGNTLVVLPTGMGKTGVALMLASQRLANFPKSKIMFLAPTRPLVEQHMATFIKHSDIKQEDMAVFTGFVSPEKRAELWKSARIVFTTPQGLENDIISDRIGLEDVSLMIFDEAHRAVGDYAYNFIAKQYNKRARYPKILGLTASPGSEEETIKEVCANLFIDNVEIRSEDDPDVRPYIQEVDIEWVKVELPESFRTIQKYLSDCYSSKIKEIRGLGYLHHEKSRFIGKTGLLELQGKLHSEISRGNKEFNILKSVSLAAEAMKVQHALELLETQGITPLSLYLEKLVEESTKTTTKAVKNLVADSNFKSALIRTRSMHEAGVEHPKIEELKRIVGREIQKQGIKILVFNQFRDSASKIESELNKISGVTAKIFVGQAKKSGTGLSQKQQKELVDQFSNNVFNVMVATSVAEEGLDIPKVDLVIFYEPIPSAIRHIQRRGRTGRLEKGSVIVLVTKGTRDEGYRWSAFHKEKRMKRTLVGMKNGMNGNGFRNGSVESTEQPDRIERIERKNEILASFTNNDATIPEISTKIFVDDREKGNSIIKELIDLGIKIDLKRIGVGDYVLSSRCAVEYKNVPDFVDSIIDGRLLQQAKDLRQNYDRPLMIVEGIEDIYSMRKIHPNAIRGMLATIAVSYGIPILQTRTSRETANLLAVIAKREQEETSKEFNMHADRKPMTMKELQEYIVSAFPGVGPALAKPLLRAFRTVKNIVNASEEDLKKIDKIGEKKAKEMQRALNEEYKF